MLRSGFQTLLGYAIKEWSSGHASMEMVVEPHHMNLGNAVHGGVLATLLDDTMGYAGVYHQGGVGPAKNAITVTMTVSFLRPAVSCSVICSATRQGGGSKVFVARGEVHTAEGALVAIGEGTYRIVAIPD